jgi:sulfide:quinone oxidoreductase
VADSKTVLILGGGVGGVATARAVRKRLPKAHRVVLVDRERDHVFAPSLLWLMVGQRTADAITRPLSHLTRKGIDVRLGNVEHIDPDRRVVTVAGQALSADYLVITLGADLAPELIPGLAQAGHNFYTRSGAESLWTALGNLRAGCVVVLTAAPAYKCPAAPYEGAMLIDTWYRKQGLRDRVQIEVYAAEPAPMGVAGPHVSSAVTDLLAAKGIPYHPGHQVTAVDAVGKRLTFANGVQADFDLLAYVPPHRAPAVIRDSSLTGESGWMSVDRHTLQTRWPDVFAIGDVVSIPLALGKPLPKAGVFANREAEVVAENIARAIAGQAQLARFDGHGDCFIEIGGGKAGFGGGDFYAEPTPAVTLRPPSRRWHLGKVWVEKSWLYIKL